MTIDRRVQYEREIRDYLLGRLASEHTTGDAERQVVEELPTAPILSWWIFEGRRFRGLDDCLALQLDRVHRQAVQLRASHNPHWRYVQAPEGDVDWVATAFVSATSGYPEYVCKTSKLGLTADELAALEGWLLWLARLWAEYVAEVQPPAGAPAAVPWELPSLAVEPTRRQLQRWAHTAKRSRWPLLRNVVAESLRCVFEPNALDALPLPADYATLFELVCIIRILRALEPTPSHIRWLDRNADKNTIVAPGVEVYFQRHVEKKIVLAGAPFDPQSAEGVRRFGIRVSQFIDGLFLFDQPRNGFEGILLEAKSGLQGPGAALFQLLCYNAALRREGVGPLIVVAAAEEGTMEKTPQVEIEQGRDLWLFVNVDDLETEVSRVLDATPIAPITAATGC